MATILDYWNLEELSYGDLITEARYNSLVDTLSQLGFFVSGIIYGGVVAGWNLATDGTVSAGAGWLSGCWCRTNPPTNISTQLVNNQVNYIYAAATPQSNLDRSVTFVADLNTAIPEGAVRLGTVTMVGGVITAVDDNPEGYRRYYLRTINLRLINDVWTGTVDAGSYVDVSADHSADVIFTVPLMPEITAITADVRVELLLEEFTTSTFKIRVYNDSSDPYATAVSISWQRWGF